MPPLYRLGVVSAAQLIRKGELSSAALTTSCLNRIRATDPIVAAWVNLDEGRARAEARRRDVEVRTGGRLGALHGIPVGIKDAIDVAGIPTTCGAASFAHYTPDRDAECVRRLKAAGAVILGKTATTEFTYFEPAETRNPWHTDHTPGGSSSGSAAAVAAGMVPLALGTQTIGSIIRPGAYSGVVGYKGTYGTVPIDGLFPMAPTLDHIGLFARGVQDIQAATSALATITTAPFPDRPPRIGHVPSLNERANPDVSAKIIDTIEAFKSAGADLAEVELPQSFVQVHDACRVVLAAEFAVQHKARYDQHARGYRPRSAELVEIGRTLTPETVEIARQNIGRFASEMRPLFTELDAIATPPAFDTAPIGLGFTGDPWFCAPWTAIGVPAIVLPISIGNRGLPYAIQMIAAHGADARLLSVAAWCEQTIGFSAIPSPSKTPVRDAT